MALTTGTSRRMLSVGASHAIELGLQMLLPILLVRILSPDDFGIYRLVWLLVMTVALTVPMGMIESLFYFLPRADAPGRLSYVRQTELYLVLASASAIALVVLARGYLPAGVARAADLGPWLIALATFWVWGTLLDTLPTIEERIRWQTLSSIVLSAVRAAVSLAAAWYWRDVKALVIALAAVSVLKVLILQIYIWRFHQGSAAKIERVRLKQQARYAMPLGVSGLLFSLRRQAEQWIVAALFTPAQFAAFSIAGVLVPLLFIARRSVSYVLLPSMSKIHAAGDLPGVLSINHRVNATLAMVLFPIFAFAFAFADVLISLVYTSAFVAAGDVMRVLIIGWCLQVVDMQSLILLLRASGYAVRVNAALLLISIPISWLGAHFGGLPGAAAGGVVALFVERAMLVRHLARRVKLPASRFQPWLELLQFAGIAASAATLGYGVTSWLELKGGFALLVGGLICGIGYGVAIFSLEKHKTLVNF
jgi:O-antigen/teichoic acid export membrane protein